MFKTKGRKGLNAKQITVESNDPRQPRATLLVKAHLDRTIKLAPLQTIEFLVERGDSSGGSGANFLVEWLGEQQTDKPLIEAVMVGAAGTQGICFGRMGIEISGASGERGAEQ